MRQQWLERFPFFAELPAARLEALLAQAQIMRAPSVTLAAIPPALFQELVLEFEPFRRFVFGMYGERR